VIRISNLTVQFGGVRPLDALDADLDAPIVGLVGPNGAGKTTLINVLSGLVKPLSGRVEADGIDLLAATATARVRWGLRRTFQTEQIVNELTTWDNVLAVLDHLPAKTDAAAQVADALAFVGLAAASGRMGAQLSLFERRLTEIARTLVGRPRLILLDEPGAGLTEVETDHLRDRVLAVPDRFGAHVVLVDHDVDLIAATCRQTLVLDFGKKLALGPTAEVLADPVVRQAYLGTA
jgi:branched-chain amino acid transport system ATP-binding protein